MNCRKVTNLISAYIDGELTGAEMLAIRRHISECPECASEFESLRGLKEAMSRLRTVTPRKDFAASIVAKIEEQQLNRRSRFSSWVTKLAYAKLSPVSAALAVFGAALVLLTAGGMEGFNTDNSTMRTAFLPQTHETSFLSEISVPNIQFEFDKPLVVTSAAPTSSSPELQFTSFNR